MVPAHHVCRPSKGTIWEFQRSIHLEGGIYGLPLDSLPLLGGSWVVISGVISPLIRVISIVTPLTTLLITTPKP